MNTEIFLEIHKTLLFPSGTYGLIKKPVVCRNYTLHTIVEGISLWSQESP